MIDLPASILYAGHMLSVIWCCLHVFRCIGAHFTWYSVCVELNITLFMLHLLIFCCTTRSYDVDVLAVVFV